jgi:hypothetical protein
MKTILTTALVAAGFALAGVSGAAAAPASGAAIGNAANLLSQIEQAQYYGGGGGYGYRRYHRPYCYYVTRCSGYGYYRNCWKEQVCR